jgi:peptide/nickel transport system permease protein
LKAYAAKRVLLFLPTIVLTTIVVFGLFWIVPGDVATLILVGADGEDTASIEDIEKLRQELGLDRPIHVQYGEWLWNVLRGDLGTSLWYRVPVTEELRGRFLVTFELSVMAIIMAFIVGVPLGVISAVKQDTAMDYASRVFALIGVAMPNFWLGVLIIYGLAYWAGWLPPLGYASLWDDPLLNLQQLVFPAMVLSFSNLGLTARVTRSSMLEVLREDYVRTARAKGLQELVVLGRHTLKNALLPVITISGYQFAGLLGGVIIIESIFVVPGVGSWTIQSIHHRDFVVLQGVIVLVAVVILTLNLIIDLFYGILDPRIRYQ